MQHDEHHGRCVCKGKLAHAILVCLGVDGTGAIALTGKLDVSLARSACRLKLLSSVRRRLPVQLLAAGGELTVYKVVDEKRLDHKLCDEGGGLWVPDLQASSL